MYLVQVKPFLGLSSELPGNTELFWVHTWRTQSTRVDRLPYSCHFKGVQKNWVPTPPAPTDSLISDAHTCTSKIKETLWLNSSTHQKDYLLQTESKIVFFNLQKGKSRLWKWFTVKDSTCNLKEWARGAWWNSPPSEPGRKSIIMNCWETGRWMGVPAQPFCLKMVARSSINLPLAPIWIKTQNGPYVTKQYWWREIPFIFSISEIRCTMHSESESILL